jgi:small subunit ribosomal protein S4e
MTHLKRQKVPKSWPIHRKGTKWVVSPNASLEHGVPVLIALRDILKVAKNRKEVKKMIHEKTILLNSKVVNDEKNSATLFDVLSVSGENHKLVLSEKGKFMFEETKNVGSKISKVVNKKVLKGKKVQLNFLDGGNLLSDVKCKTNDSVVINFKDKKVEKCLELKEKVNAAVFGGKHIGAKGKIENIDMKHRIVELSDGKNMINVLIKHLVVVE